MKYTRKKCLKLWAEIIKERDKVCVVCGSEYHLNSHHLVDRKYWPFGEGLLLCAGCHSFSFLSAHRNGVWFSEWLKENRPKLFLKIKNYSYKKTKPPSYISVYEKLLKEKS